ncbi:MAG: O-antigen ligase family protein [Candidatus Vogelbacteria bacterium]|nr:O-antigen ligase family protein [Candidatus Vogelbacteria bacterium]
MQTNKWLRWGILAGLFVTPFIAFIVPYSTFFPFITGKNFVFRILVEIIFALWLVLCLHDKSYWPRKSWIMWSATTFVIVLAIADIFGANQERSFWSNYERMEGLVMHLHLFMYFLMASSVMVAYSSVEQSRKVWHWLFNTSIGASVIMMLYAFMQAAGKFDVHQGVTRLDATLGNSAYMAIYMVFHIFFLFYFICEVTTSKAMKWFYGVVAFLEVIILYKTATRGAIIGLVVGVLASLVIYAVRSKESEHAKKVVYGAIAAIVLVILVFFAVQNTSLVQNNPTLQRFTVKTLVDTVYTRSTIWSMAFEGFKENPVLGWGQDNFNFVFNKYYSSSLYAQEPWFDRAHNVFFDWLIAGGLLGLLAYLALYISGLWTLWKLHDDKMSIAAKAIFTGLFVAYFVHNFTVFDNLISYVLFFTVLAFIHSISLPHHEKHVSEVFQMPEAYRYAMIALVVVLAVVTIYKVNVPAIQANRVLLKAINPTYPISEQINNFKTAIELDSFGTPEAREQLMQSAIRQIQGNGTQAEKEQYLMYAEQQMLKQITESPNDARYRVFIGTFYEQLGKHELAITELGKAHELSPGKQTILFGLTSAYLNLKNYPKALELAKQAYELEPRFDEAAYNYLATLIYSGKSDEVDQLIQNRFEGQPVTYGTVIAAYAATKQYSKLIKIWQDRIKSEPTNGQNYVSLAATYLAMGERQLAIEQLKSAIQVNPGFKDQGEFYIKEIQAGRNP